MASSDPKREWLQPTLASVAYGGAKAMQNAPEIFARFKDPARALGRILVHRGDLLEWPLFQGPIADAWTHGWRLDRLRLAGASVGGENYFVAGVGMGGVGPEPDAPQRVF
jgi:hypothetical protein